MKIQQIINFDVPELEALIYRARKADARPLHEIASMAGMSAANWYRIEQGKQVVPLETLEKMIEALEQK